MLFGHTAHMLCYYLSWSESHALTVLLFPPS